MGFLGLSPPHTWAMEKGLTPTKPSFLVAIWEESSRGVGISASGRGEKKLCGELCFGLPGYGVPGPLASTPLLCSPLKTSYTG